MVNCARMHKHVFIMLPCGSVACYVISQSHFCSISHYQLQGVSDLDCVLFWLGILYYIAFMYIL